MSIKGNIRKILLLSLSIMVGTGLLVLLIAAISKKNHKNCTGVEISINDKSDERFLNRQDVLTIVAPDKSHPLKGRPLASFNLTKMENDLEQNTWVRNAEVFLDNNGVLRVVIKERIPVARIFTVNGNSFYIDSSGKHLPLSSRLAVKLPVYTNFPADKETLYGADSLLMQQIKQMSPFIMNDPFWMAQIGQIDITPDRSFEMMPVVGKHLIQFGDGTDYEAKFHRLFLFYQQVGAKAGLDKYAAINVQFNNQVVATRKGPAGKIDSIQAIKNIQKLIESSRQLANDTVSTMVDNNIATSAAAAPPLTILNDNRRNAAAKDSLNHAVVAAARSSPVKKRVVKPAQQNKPKAVMRRQVNNR